MRAKKNNLIPWQVDSQEEFRKSVEKIANIIKGSESFVIAVHERPDPDAIGSALAISYGLSSLGKNALVLSVDGVPDTCEYLPGADKIVKGVGDSRFDVGIVCDAGNLGRIGGAAAAFENVKNIVIIDHHPGEVNGNDSRKAFLLVVPQAAATAEIVAYLLKDQMQVEITRDIARQLMAAIVGDTGALRFANVTSVTLETAAMLTSLGASPAEAASEIYENRSIANVKLLGAALTAISSDLGGKLVWSRITLQDFERCGGTDSDTDSIVNQLVAVKGAQVAVLFREIEKNKVRVSLRSKGSAEVNGIAAKFGGGGHAAAAGCTIEAPLPEAEMLLLSEVRAWMES